METFQSMPIDISRDIVSNCSRNLCVFKEKEVNLSVENGSNKSSFIFRK